MARAYAPFVRKIEVEVETLDQVREAVEAGADIIMLDNMSDEAMKEAVQFIAGRAEVECSGNVTREKYQTVEGHRCGLCVQRRADPLSSDFGSLHEASASAGCG